MARIIPFNTLDHEEVLRLLPWYITGELDTAEQSAVHAHLADCTECQAELAWEQKLSASLELLPLAKDVELGASSPAKVRRGQRRSAWLRLLQRPATVGWALAAQVAIVISTATIWPLIVREPTYHALSAPQPQAVGNVVVMFRPEAREHELRQLLEAIGAKIVDGPTASDAYVLWVEPRQRPAALARLRAQRAVVLAQPIDQPTS